MTSAKKTCFLIGPMRGHDDMERQRRLATIVGEAFKKLGRADFKVLTPVQPERGDIVQQVIKELDRADIVVADLTGNNPSVIYELAVRHCTGLPCLHVQDESAKHDVPLAFDIRQYRYAAVNLSSATTDNDALVEMLKTVVHEADNPSNQPGDPVTTYFNVPLTDVYPASGLAIGYCQNMVVRVAEAKSLMAKERLAITVRIPNDENVMDLMQARTVPQSLTDAEWERVGWRDDLLNLKDTEWEKVKLTIWIPDDINLVLPKYIAELKRTGEFYDVILKHPKEKFRPIPLLIRRGTLQLVDIPTTLRVIETSVKERLGFGDAERAKLLAREFDRFGRSLKYWIEQRVENDERQDRQGDDTRFLNDHVFIENLPKEYKISTLRKPMR